MSKKNSNSNHGDYPHTVSLSGTCLPGRPDGGDQTELKLYACSKVSATQYAFSEIHPTRVL